MWLSVSFYSHANKIIDRLTDRPVSNLDNRRSNCKVTVTLVVRYRLLANNQCTTERLWYWNKHTLPSPPQRVYLVLQEELTVIHFYTTLLFTLCYIV